MVGEAVQHLMEACLEAGSVAAVLRSQVRETVAQRLSGFSKRPTNPSRKCLGEWLEISC